jgi:hypothetical protein
MAIAAPFPAASSSARRTPRTTARPARRATARDGVRLTRRGRIAVGVLSALFLLVVMVVSGRMTADAGTAAGDQGRATGVVVVQPGESLWQIAKAIAPQTDPRATVTLLRELNGLGDSVVVPGQSIVVPVAGAPA